MYTDQQFAERNQQMTAERQQAMNEDPDIVAARSNFVRSQKDLDDLQSSIRNLPIQQRLQYNGNITQARQAIIDAEKAVRTAENSHVRRAYLAKLEAAKNEQAQVQQQQQTKFAQEAEAEAKEQFKASYLRAGGTLQGFETAWPAMWRKELEQRAVEQLTGAKRAMERQRGYNL